MIDKLLSVHSPLIEAINAIEISHRRMAVVVSQDGNLLGTLTDGDIRRHLLAGGNLQTSVSEMMNTHPIKVTEGNSTLYMLDIMNRHHIMAVPLVSSSNRFIRLIHRSDLAPFNEVEGKANFAFAVIMAGGEGMRLRPITDNIPKPMLDIGGTPLLERQIQRLAKAGIPRIYLSVSYLSKIIEDYFGDGSNFGLEIRYLREHEKLGTGGALALLPEKPTAPIVVMNGDILTTSDFVSMNAFHCSQGAELTVSAVNYCINIPFGVIRNAGSYMTSLVEKPSQHFLCNAGIYALSPSVLEQLPKDGPFNMTDLIDHFLTMGKSVAVFPMHEYWSDIGSPADLNKARIFFGGQYEQ